MVDSKIDLLEARLRRQELKSLAMVCLIIIICGAFLNLIVVTMNGGKMPVMIPEKYGSFVYETQTHFFYSDKTEINHWYFSDVIDLSVVGIDAIASIGDFVMIAGLLYLLYVSTLVLKQDKKIRRTKKIIGDDAECYMQTNN